MYVAVMLRRMMEAIINKDAMDDKVIIRNSINICFFQLKLVDYIRETVFFRLCCQVELLNINLLLSAVCEDLIVIEH